MTDAVPRPCLYCSDDDADRDDPDRPDPLIVTPIAHAASTADSDGWSLRCPICGHVFRLLGPEWFENEPDGWDDSEDSPFY